MILNNVNKPPLPTTTPEAIAAANQVTPERLSQLLTENGPLAIRHITKQLSQEIPCFRNLSNSKQRRLIINAMQVGDYKNNKLFEKIGWGQWSIRNVDPSDFEIQRKLTNLQNSQFKCFNQTVVSSCQTKESIVYIDENIIQSDDERERECEQEQEQTIENRIIKAKVKYPHRKRVYSFPTTSEYEYGKDNSSTKHNRSWYYTKREFTEEKEKEEGQNKKRQNNSTSACYENIYQSSTSTNSRKSSYSSTTTTTTTSITSNGTETTTNTKYSIESNLRSTLMLSDIAFSFSSSPSTIPLLLLTTDLGKMETVSLYSDTVTGVRIVEVPGKEIEKRREKELLNTVQPQEPNTATCIDTNTTAQENNDRIDHSVAYLLMTLHTHETQP